MSDHMRRVRLLSKAEIDDIYAFPVFNVVEQSLYLDFSDEELALTDQYRTIKAKVYFLLSLGYFKAKQQFYKFDLNQQQDAAYIVNAYFPDFKEDNTNGSQLSGQIHKRTYKSQKQVILNHLNCHDWSPELAGSIKAKLCKLLRHYPKPHNAIRQLISYLGSQQIIVPSYRILQDIFSDAHLTEGKRINKILSSIPENIKQNLSDLIMKEDGISQLNSIRADQKDFQYTAVKTEIGKAQLIFELHEFSKKIIPELELSKNAVTYYAEIAEQYSASRLRRLSEEQQWLHILCFVNLRYRQIMDNLITTFEYHTKSILDASKVHANLAEMEHQSKLVVDFPKLAEFLKWFPTRDSNLSHEQINEAAYDILPEEQFPVLAAFLEGSKFDKEAAKWQFYLKSSRLFSLYLRPILLAVDFEYYEEGAKITELMTLLKNHYQSGKNPGDFKLSDDLGFTIKSSDLAYLKKEPSDECVDPYLFEFYVYKKIYHALGRGKLFCNDSVNYCDIEKDLVDDALVDEVEAIAAEFGHPKIPIYCDQRLNEAADELTMAWDRTLGNIESGKNSDFEIKPDDKGGEQDWRLLYDSSEKLEDAFFKTLPKSEIADVLLYIGEITGMWDGFSHIKGRYIKRTTPEPLPAIACILSEAFGFGEAKMADMCDLAFEILRATRQDFIRVDTLCAVSDIVSNRIKSLPIFKEWNLLNDKLLADADGQKFVTTNQTIQSRFSRKYLGKGKGISLYTLLANFVAVNAKTIGLNEYEGHSLYDMIYNNKTDIDIDFVTGDNHSLNQLNFVALDSIDVEYVPSIKNVREAANHLASIKPTAQYSGIITPKEQINLERIKSQKRGILRVLLSLILQENTQSNIIRKLNSHARYARLRAALFEYNKLLKSTHILNMIDNLPLRKAIRTARNRTEAYHQLQSLIRKVYNGIFKGKKVVDNRVSAHAARLIANCIIAYSSTILNNVYLKMVKDGKSRKLIEDFCRISPIAWSHLLFTGRYSFKKSKGDIDIVAMTAALEGHLQKSDWQITEAMTEEI